MSVLILSAVFTALCYTAWVKFSKHGLRISQFFLQLRLKIERACVFLTNNWKPIVPTFGYFVVFFYRWRWIFDNSIKKKRIKKGRKKNGWRDYHAGKNGLESMNRTIIKDMKRTITEDINFVSVLKKFKQRPGRNKAIPS